MKYYRPPLVQLAVLDPQRVPAVPAVLSPIPVKWSPVPVKWSPIPVVTASMSKSAQVAPVGYGQMSVMLQSLPASCGLPVASLKSHVPMPPEKPEPPDLVVMQSHSGTDYHQPMSQLSDISRSAYPEYPLLHHRYPACPAPELQQARSP
ncbi:hypothetical protein Tco_0655016 [Tanacetum coccineum]|uniref:Uncharacterized protein n=1 Tax=Tanacetum coccineum TaxID=301880 RepID=A0ABQ4X556_9ASTR